jgi:2-polyprenyl-3-methyl-5-hydroxy-6-metoxy-1,4-benzoquinol methylase
MKRPQLTVIQRAVLERAAALGLPAGARILDAPCGSGALAAALAERGFTAVGADLDTQAGALLGPAFSQVNLNESLPWKEQTFNAVFSTEGIEHLENHFSFLREICRILKPGGILLLTTPNITALRSRVRFFGSGFFGRDSRPLNEAARHPLHHIGLISSDGGPPHAHQTNKLSLCILRAVDVVLHEAGISKRKRP